MKITDAIKEFMPCEVCGNNDIKNFYFHVLVDQGSQPYVKCCECEEEYYSPNAKAVLTKAIEDRKAAEALRPMEEPGNYKYPPFIEMVKRI